MDVLWVTEDSELRKQKDDPFHYRKASELGRYLLTHDEDFWNDHGYPLYQCPGLILLATYDTEIAKYLPQLLQKVMDDYNPTEASIYAGWEGAPWIGDPVDTGIGVMSANPPALHWLRFGRCLLSDKRPVSRNREPRQKLLAF
jgi:hypothetical protein